MQAASDFALQLAVGVKDIYSEKIAGIKATSTDLRKETERLQKGMADIGAYQKADEAVSKLAKKEGLLRKTRGKNQSEQKTLLKQRDALLKRQKSGIKLTEKEQSTLNDLNREIKTTERREQDLSRELERVTTEAKHQSRALNKMGTSLNKAGIDTKDLRGDLKKLETQMQDVGKEAKKTKNWDMTSALADGAVAAAGGTIIASLTGQVIEWDKSIRQFAAGVEYTVEEAKGLEPYLRGVQATLNGIDPGVLTETTTKIVQQMHLQGKAAVDVAEQIHMLNKVHQNQDPDEIIRATSRANIVWGAEAAVTLDLISTALEKAGDPANDLLDTFWEYAGVAEQAGLSVQQFTAMMIEGLNSGAFNYDKIADTLKGGMEKTMDIDQWDKLIGQGTKKGLIDQLIGDDKKASQRLKNLMAQLRDGMQSKDDGKSSKAWGGLMANLSALYAKDAHKGRNLIEGIFSGIGADDITNKVLASMGSGIANAQSILGDYHGKTKAAFDEQQTYLNRLSGAWLRLSGQFGMGAGRIMEGLAPIGEVLIYLIDGAAGLVEAWPGVTNVIVGATAALTGLKGVLMVKGAIGWIAGLGGSAASLTGFLKGAGSAAMSLARGAATLLVGMGPVGWVLLAIGAAAGLVYTYWDELKSLALDLWAVIKEPLAMAWDLTPIKQLWDAGNQLWDWWQTVDLSEAGANLINTLVSGAEALIGLPAELMAKGVAKATKWWDDLDLSESGKKMMSTLVEGIVSMASAPFDAVKGALSDVRKLLPFSDAKEGPLSDLTLSGKRLITTLAHGVAETGRDVLKIPLAKQLAQGTAGMALGVPLLAAAASNTLPTHTLPTLPAVHSTLPATSFTANPIPTRAGVQIGNITFSPTISLEVHNDTNPEAIAEAVMAVIKGRSTELVLEVEQLLEEVWQRQEFKTTGY